MSLSFLGMVSESTTNTDKIHVPTAPATDHSRHYQPFRAPRTPHISSLYPSNTCYQSQMQIGSRCDACTSKGIMWRQHHYFMWQWVNFHCFRIWITDNHKTSHLFHWRVKKLPRPVRFFPLHQFLESQTDLD